MLAASALPAAARAAGPKPYFDVRSEARAGAPAAATRALERRLGPQAVVDVDRVTRTPRVLARLDRTLSGPAAGDPGDVALRYVRANLAALGLGEADLDTLRPPSVTTAGGVTQVRWRQAVGGIPAADSELRVNVTDDGRVLSVLGAPAHGLDPDTTPRLDAGEAARAVQEDVGVFRSLPRVRGSAGPTRATKYVDGTTAELALYAQRLAWRVTYRAASDAVYDAMVDAQTGRVLKRANLVKSAANALVWEQYPGAPQGGTAISRDLEGLQYLPAGASVLDGPSVRAFSDLDDDDELRSLPGELDDEEIRRTNGTFAFPFSGSASAALGCDATHLCSWNHNVSGSWRANRQQNGVQAFYFANEFHDHLAAAPINFTTGSFEGADKLVLNTDDGALTGPNSAHLDNANMLTPPDGGSPLMQMYLWRLTPHRDVNGGDDAAILYHEYTHGLSNRLVKDASGVGALNSAQAGAMGEGWSDWYAKDYVVSQFPTLDTGAPDVEVGVYTDSTPHSIRTQPLDCPVGTASLACPGAGAAGLGGYTYGDFGKVSGEPEVHADGEIWAETLWDLRTAVGSTDAERLVTQGMRLSPAEPSFLDMRNAILQADQAAGGTRRAAIWAVFAHRGMGFYATADAAAGVSPIPDDSTPPAPGDPRGRIAGRVTDAATGAPVAGARAAIGGLEQGPDALAATSAADGSYAIESVPAHSYQTFVFTAPGYDRLIRPVAVGANATATADVTLRRNWAARPGGATTTGAGSDEYANLGCGPDAAVDQLQGTGWSTDRSSAGKSMVVTLPQAVDVERFEVDPGEACGDDGGSATSAYRLETSTTGTGGPWTVAAEGTFAAESGQVMTPVVPTAGASGVRHVRVTLRANFGGAFFDLSELAVYGAPAATSAPPPTSTATSTPPPAPPAAPTPTPAPAPAPAGPARPSFTLAASGNASIRFKLTCRAACRVTARLTVDARTARRLGLGRSRTAGTLTLGVEAGTVTLTLELSSKAARGLKRAKPRSFRATLKVSAGYAGSSAVTTARRVTIRRWPVRGPDRAAAARPA